MSGKYQETHGEDENGHHSCEDVSSGSDVIDIDPGGGLLLHVKHYNESGQVYRVSVMVLRKASAYFDALLDPAKFSEGAAVRTRLVELTKVYAEAESMPASDLPRIAISDIGPVPKAKISEAAFKLFLDILHYPKASFPTPHIHLICILALVADRFDGTSPISSYILEHDWKKKLAKQDKTHKSELKSHVLHRQKLLIGLILGFQDWVYQYSSELIYQGLEKGTSDSADVDEEAPWRNFPHGVEEELIRRRVYLFETLGSMQSHFLHLYSRSSQQPQCRLGYDSSWQCDSFQLGEMIRYFTRKGTLSMQNTFIHAHDAPQFAGSLEDLVSVLRQCPAYQIDTNHSHCGARTRLEPALKSIVPALTRSGICLLCWKRNRGEDSWLENPTGGAWYLGKPRLSRLFPGCPDHRTIKAVCTADERDWTPPHG